MKEVKIKVIQEGLLNEAIESPKTYTENEFIKEYGCQAYDDIIDLYFEFHNDEKDENGHIKFWEDGLFVELWEA